MNKSRIDILEERCIRLRKILDDTKWITSDNILKEFNMGHLSVNDIRFLFELNEIDEPLYFKSKGQDLSTVESRLVNIQRIIELMGETRTLIPIELINERNKLVSELNIKK